MVIAYKLDGRGTEVCRRFGNIPRERKIDVRISILRTPPTIHFYCMQIKGVTIGQHSSLFSVPGFASVEDRPNSVSGYLPLDVFRSCTTYSSV